MLSKQFCKACANEVAGPASNGKTLVIKSRATLYDGTTGDAVAICSKCKTENPIIRKLVIPIVKKE